MQRERVRAGVLGLLGGVVLGVRVRLHPREEVSVKRLVERERERVRECVCVREREKRSL
jgi:hypothetical protein